MFSEKKYFGAGIKGELRIWRRCCNTEILLSPTRPFLKYVLGTTQYEHTGTFTKVGRKSFTSVRNFR